MARLDRVVWIGGAQWAGKTSVAQALAVRFGLIHYAYDYHDARAHLERARREPERFPHRAATARAVDDGSFFERWVEWTPEQLAEDARADHIERFQMVLDDLERLPGDASVVAEGWGLRPELVAPLLDTPQRAVFLVPSEQFQMTQVASLPRAMRIAAPVSDPDRAQRNRLARDRILAAEMQSSAEALGLRVIVVDGASDLAATIEAVTEQFAPLLPRWLY